MRDNQDMDADTLPDDIAAANSMWEIRLRMAARGWISKTRIMRHARAADHSFQIWFSRGDWHGYLSDVNIHGGCKVRMDADPVLEAGRMREEVRTIASRAARGWIDFPDSIPCQGLDGSLVRNGWSTKREMEDRQSEHFRGRPTERMPLDMPALWKGADSHGDALAQRMLAIAAMGAVYEDDITPLRWSLPGWHLERRWGFEHDVTFPDWYGIRTDWQPIRQSTPELSHAFAEALLEGTQRMFSGFLDTYYPGSPNGDLPPCLKPSNQPLFEAEQARRAMELRETPLAMEEDVSAIEGLAAVWEARRLADPMLSRKWCEITVEHVMLEVENARLLAVPIRQASSTPEEGMSTTSP